MSTKHFNTGQAAKYIEAFRRKWAEHMANGGAKESENQRIEYRRVLYDELSRQYPQVGRYVEAARSYHRLRATGGKGFKGRARMTKAERTGMSIIQQIARGQQEETVSETEEPYSIEERYRQCVETGGVPTDKFAALLLGTTVESVHAMRHALESEYTFVTNGIHLWYVVRPKPKPLTLAERIEQALTKLKDEDKEAIVQLLEENTQS